MSVPAYRVPLRGSTTSERSGTAGRPSLVPTSYHDWAASFDSQSWLPNGLGGLPVGAPLGGESTLTTAYTVSRLVGSTTSCWIPCVTAGMLRFPTGGGLPGICTGVHVMPWSLVTVIWLPSLR